MNDLTEKWKNGELPIGWYYTKLWEGCNIIDEFIGNQFLRYDDSDIVEVIAPVPSYEEWQRVLHYAGKYECEYTSCVMDYENLKEENKMLRDSAKRWQTMYENLKKEGEDVVNKYDSLVMDTLKRDLSND